MKVLLLFASLIPFDSPLNNTLEYFQTRGLTPVYLIQPVDWSDVLADIETLLVKDEMLNPVDRGMFIFFGPFFKKNNLFNTTFTLNAGKKSTEFFGNFDFQAARALQKHCTFAQGIRFHFTSQPDYAGPKPWKDIVQAYLNEGYIKFADNQTIFVVGRRNLLLGPNTDYSLLLSPAREGYDGILFSHHGKYYAFHTTFSVLDARKMRFLATHRIGLVLNKLQLGFSESILWAHDLEPLYLNPLLPYYLSQWGMDRNDNIMWSFDGIVNLRQTLIFGELLIDDYQFSEPPAGYTEYPHKLAFQLGLKKILGEKLFVKLRYTFVDKWVYSHELPYNTYEDDSLCLGFPLGNDVDQLGFDLRFYGIRKLFPKIKFEFVRKGEGNIYLPYEIERGPAYPPFPSGIVEKSIDILIGLTYSPQSFLHINCEVGKKYFYNFAHHPSQNKTENQLNVYGWLIF